MNCMERHTSRPEGFPSPLPLRYQSVVRVNERGVRSSSRPAGIHECVFGRPPPVISSTHSSVCPLSPPGGVSKGHTRYISSHPSLQETREDEETPNSNVILNPEGTFATSLGINSQPAGTSTGAINPQRNCRWEILGCPSSQTCL